MKSEILAVWASLDQIAVERDSQQAVGLLNCVKKKRFVVILYLLDSVLPSLLRLCDTFQSASLNFSHMEFALKLCQNEIHDISSKQTACKMLLESWHRFESELGELTDVDADFMHKMTVTYCDMLLRNIGDRFPEPKVLSAFRVFDVHVIPEAREERIHYADADLIVLSEKFQLQDPGKLMIDWASFAERLVMLKLQQPRCVENAAKVCSLVINDAFYSEAWPEIVKLAKTALTIPLTSVDPERGFSHLKLIKTHGRSRLLDETLSALMNISINGTASLEDDDARHIAEKWLGKKERRQVTARGQKNVGQLEKKLAERKRKDQENVKREFTSDSDEEYEYFLGLNAVDMPEEMEFNKFWL